MDYINDLEHRLAMVQDDQEQIRAFIYANKLDDIFQSNPTPMCDEAMTHLNNIEIACDLTSEESRYWTKFNTK
jgi:hypothetical protein